MRKVKSQYVFVYLMILFAVVQFVVFYVVVNFNSIVMAFKYYEGIDDNYNEVYSWSLNNFQTFFAELRSPTSIVKTALLNTLRYFGANILITLPLSYIVSYFLYKKIFLHKFFRVVFFLPSIISAIVFVTMFKNMVGTFGPIYEILKKLFGYEMPPLLNESTMATNTIIFFTIWTGLGVNMILYQGAMNRIPQEVIEVGRIDGIGWTRELVNVVTPMIWPTLSTTIILAMTGLFNSGGPILLFSQAGSMPGGADTTTIAFWIFQQTWLSISYEYPAAVGIFFTVISLPIVFLVRFGLSKVDPGVEY